MAGHSLRKALRALIPAHISNRAVLFVYHLISRHGRFGKLKTSEESGEEKSRPEGFLPIEDQRRRTGEIFGRSTVAHAGCEVIALYNAVGSLTGRMAEPLSAWNEVFRRRGMVFGGRFGTSPKALYRWLKKNGFPAVWETRADLFDETAQGFPCAILSYYNDGLDILRGVHTVCLTREDGGFVAHNLTEDGNPSPVYPTIRMLLSHAGKGSARGLCLIAIGLKDTYSAGASAGSSAVSASSVSRS